MLLLPGHRGRDVHEAPALQEAPATVLADELVAVATDHREEGKPVLSAVHDGNLTLSANSPENGSAFEELEIDYGGQDIEIGFNSRYLLDIAHQIEGDGAQFVMADASSPTIVRDAADGNALYVLMPMRV